MNFQIYPGARSGFNKEARAVPHPPLTECRLEPARPGQKRYSQGNLHQPKLGF